MRTIGLITLSLAMSAPLVSADQEKAIALLTQMDQLYQQDSAQARMSMHIVTPDFERTLTMDSWSLGLDYALVRVLEPVRDRGVSTLKRDDEMWNFLPRVNRTVRVSPSMMMGSWMGSDFTNDDLMRETSWVDEYDVRLEEQGDLYVLHLIPREQTVTVWGAMEITLRQSDLLPVSQRYFDESGALMRVMEFSDIRDFGGVTLPATMTLRPVNKPGQITRITYEALSFDVDLDESFFSLQNLRRVP